MRRSVVVALVLAVGLVAAPAASAQTLIGPPLIDIGGSHGQGGAKKKSDDKRKSNCSPTVLVLCGVGPVASGAADLARAGVEFAADAVLGGVVRWAANGAAWLLKTIGTQIDRSTRPALGSPWFGERYAAMRTMALSLVVVFLLAAIMQATVRQDLQALLRAVLVALPLGVLLTFAAVTLAEMALALTDAMTAAALSGAGTDARDGLTDLAKILSPAAVATPALPGLVLFLGAILTAILALLVWVELILREAAIYVALAFLPITLVAITWQRTGHWARRLAEWLGALILAKFAIAGSFGVAGAMLGEARAGSGGLSALLGGCAVLLVAALSPWVLLRLIPFAEGAAGGLHRSHVGGAVMSVPGAAASVVVARRAMAKSFGAPAAVAASRPAPPPPAAEPMRAPESTTKPPQS